MASPTPIINGNMHFKRRVRDTGLHAQGAEVSWGRSLSDLEAAV